MILGWKHMALWKKIFIGLCLGLLVGLLFKDVALMLKPVGTLFINMIKMLIVPLVFVTLVTGITSMEDLSKMRRIGIKTFSIYLITTAIAVAIGLAFGLIFEPGAGVALSNTAAVAAKKEPPLVDTLLALIPTNPMESLVKGDILQIIVFAIFLGIAISMAGEKGKPVAAFFESFSEVMFKLTEIVISFAPIGVFGLMAWVSASYGVDVLISLAKVIGCVYIASIIHMALTMGGGIALIARLNPIKFFKGVVSAQTVAFTTTSSSGTLPITTSNTIHNLGVSKPIASFVLPLGATINMDGTAIYQGICAVFVAQAFGVDLTFANYLTIILTATLASIGTAGVPGAGLIMLSLVLTSVNLPLEGIAIIAGIDRILDMARTTVNITGDAMTAVIVAKGEGELDEKIYNQDNVE
ncbi:MULTISPECIES: dicarboxylate/amino acid:cation symporter [unclassified Sulfurospirillum]|uniref:dicarboxylate/amino acid:cation symporter n=1 Tax=unclassified Sulfurospirillum TaxID=2618290 RepID=UPI0005085748|nr:MULTISPECIES: dicarboxylate/amino acid:cation symporter [unclassified Sulfurospirillum]KFL33160.1 sodium:dicarboxylate symporter [Sulfurospirillum sp. SCADC]